MYLVLAVAVTQNTTVNYQSVGREITTVSSLKALELVPRESEVIVFYDSSLDLQKLLDLYYLLDLKYRIVVNNTNDEEIFLGLFTVYNVDYKTIDGGMIRAIKYEDSTAMKSLERDKSDKLSSAFRRSYLSEVDGILNSTHSNAAVKTLAMSYKNLFAAYTEEKDRLTKITQDYETSRHEVFSLRQSLRKYSLDMKTFISYFTNLQNKYRAITALSVVKENASIMIPQQLTSLYIKDYGIPHVYNLISAIYDSLTTFYKKYVKVVYICEPDGISINRLPSSYKLLTNVVQQSDILGIDFLACVGNVNVPLEFLLTSSSFNTLIVVDGRRVQETLFTGETMFLNLAPDFETAQALGLLDDITITPSTRSKYVLREETLVQDTSYGSRNSKLVNMIVNTLLERRGEI